MGCDSDIGWIVANAREALMGAAMPATCISVDILSVCSRIYLLGFPLQSPCSKASKLQVPVAPPPPPEVPPVNTDIQTIQLDGNIKLFQCFCNSHLRYEAEYGRKRGTTTNSYLVTDGDEAMLIDVPRKAYVETFCKLQSWPEAH